MLAYLVSGHRGPLIVTYHSDIVRQRFLGAAFQPIQNLLLNRADAIIVGSRNYMDSSPVLSMMRDRCHVIPYGIDTGPFGADNRQKVREIKERFGSKIILAVGRLVSYKGFEYLIRAMKRRSILC